MKAIILAGGEGQRLRPLTFAIPKPLIPINDTPIIELLLKSLKRSGIEEVILAVGYKANFIKQFLGDGSSYGIKISYYDEDSPLGTAGPVKAICDEFNLKEDVLVMNGDILTKLNFQDLIQFHNSSKNDFTIGTALKNLKTKYGVLDLDGDKVTGMREKPSFPVSIMAGIYIMSPKTIEIIPQGFYNMDSMVKDSIKAGHDVKSFMINHYWSAIDRMVDFGKAQEKASGELKEWLEDLNR